MPVNNDFLTLTEESRDIPHNLPDGKRVRHCAYMPVRNPQA